jgi:hypothetical protein
MASETLSGKEQLHGATPAAKNYENATLSESGRMQEPTGMMRELLAPQGGNVFIGVGVSAWSNRCEWE